MINTQKKLKASLLYNFMYNHFVYYRTPVDINYLFSFGFLGGFFLASQVLTGLFLSIYYAPNIVEAFASLEYIIREVQLGYIIKYLHANIVTFIFIAMFIHIFRNIMFASQSKQKWVLWVTGAIIFILMVTASFFGYTLPWGSMSYWASVVITSFLTLIPYSGSMLIWIWGGYSVGGPTLKFFFILHFVTPFVVLFMVSLHIYVLHDNGTTSPSEADSHNSINFGRFLWIKDAGVAIISVLFIIYVLYKAPNYFSHPDNYIKANPLKTPAHIVPEWYLLPFYGLLKSQYNKTYGGAIVAGFFFTFVTWPLFFSKYYIRDFSFCEKKQAFSLSLIVLISLLSYGSSRHVGIFLGFYFYLVTFVFLSALILYDTRLEYTRSINNLFTIVKKFDVFKFTKPLGQFTLSNALVPSGLGSYGNSGKPLGSGSLCNSVPSSSQTLMEVTARVSTEIVYSDMFATCVAAGLIVGVGAYCGTKLYDSVISSLASDLSEIAASKLVSTTLAEHMAAQRVAISTFPPKSFPHPGRLHMCGRSGLREYPADFLVDLHLKYCNHATEAYEALANTNGGVEILFTNYQEALVMIASSFTCISCSIDINNFFMLVDQAQPLVQAVAPHLSDCSDPDLADLIAQIKDAEYNLANLVYRQLPHFRRTGIMGNEIAFETVEALKPYCVLNVECNLYDRTLNRLETINIMQIRREARMIAEARTLLLQDLA